MNLIHITSILCLVISVLHAYENHIRLNKFIKGGNRRKIKHGIEGLKYMGFITVLGCIGLLFGINWMYWVFSGFFARLAFFDPSFSIFRGKSFFYNGDAIDPAIQDKLENILSPDFVKGLKIAYVSIFIVYQLINPLLVVKLSNYIKAIFI